LPDPNLDRARRNLGNNMNNLTDPGRGPQQARDESVVKLLAHVFHGRFVRDANVPQAQKGHVAPAYFCGWLDEHASEFDPEEVCREAGVDVEIWQFVRQMLESGMAPERLSQVWYAIVLSDRPLPKYPLDRINLVMLLTWADGSVMPVQVVVSREMMDQGPGFNDGLVASIVSKNVVAFRDAIVDDGLDGLHDKPTTVNYRGSTPEDPFDVFMGLLVKFIPQLRPELQKPVRDYKLLAQGIIRPVLPPAVMQALEAKKRQWQNKGRAAGGWDV
jgi:hypothetical protein